MGQPHSAPTDRPWAKPGPELAYATGSPRRGAGQRGCGPAGNGWLLLDHDLQTELEGAVHNPYKVFFFLEGGFTR